MRKIYTPLTFLVLLLLNFTVLRAQQVTVSNSTGANGTYLTLKAAFDAINAQPAQAGNNIVITIIGSTTETLPAVLNQPSTSSWTSLIIYPTVTGITISGNIASAPIIDLNGADKVTIDGRLNATGSTADLTISNTSISTASGTSTIRFIESAENNMVKYCNITGSTRANLATTTTGGIIYFSTASSGSGNSNDTISYCNISSNAAGRATNAIISLGSLSLDNNAVTISNNNIFNFLNPLLTSSGIYIQNNSTAWNISGNSFYETTIFAPTTTQPFYAINISNAANGDNMTITNNYIGGNAPLCAGTFTKTTSNNIFYGMYLSLGSSFASNIHGNTIRNFSWTNTLSPDWFGILFNSGIVNIGTLNGNIIGDTNGTASISITNGTASTGSFYGIRSNGGNGFIQNNAVGAITTFNNLDTINSTKIYGIYLNSPAALTVSNNLIGSLTTANSINASSKASTNPQTLSGIFVNGNGNMTISNNTIANLTNGAIGNLIHLTQGIKINNTNSAFSITNNIIRDISINNANVSTDHNSAIIGILAYSPGANKTVSGNTVYNLTNINSSASGQSIIGLYINCGTATQNTFSKNFIHSISSNSASELYGIKIQGGANLLTNNIISLDGNSASNIYGIYENGAAGNNNNLYFNTVYLAGLPNTASANSYALYSNSSLNTRNIRNNIFFNARSNSGSAAGKHYAVLLNSNSGLTINYNDYFSNGIGNELANFNTSDIASLAALQSATGQDANSLNINPNFLNAGGLAALDYMPNALLTGITGTLITTDYFVVNRSLPTMGAIESSNVDVFSSNVYQSTYATLKDAFDAINAGTHQGVLTIKVKGSTTETVTAVLNTSGGTANYSSVNIYPVNSGLTIGGSLAAPLVDLYGADHVCFDGRVNATGSTADLIITNADISTAANNSTIRFRESAENNSIKYCNVKGSNTTAASGIIYFSTAAAGNGNDNDTITLCNISSDTPGRTLNAIYAEGSSGFDNNNIVISNNNIFNYFNPAFNSAGIYTSSFNSGWNIINNSFYDTSAFSPTATASYYGIKINAATGTNFLISNNYIGGNSPLCNGFLNKAATSSNAFTGIDIAVGNTVASNIQANIIKKVNWLNNATAVSNWTAINVSSGAADIGTVSANIIGSATGIDSLTVSNSTYTTAQPFIIGIASQSLDAVTIQNNTIGALRSANNDNTSPTGIYGIFTSGAGTYSISNNIIGSITTTNSIYASSSSTGNQQDIFGIYSLGSGTLNISSNTIANLTNATLNTSAINSGRLKGISLVNSGTANVSTNTVRDLKSTSLSGTAANDTIAAIIGIQVNNSAAGSGNRSVTANTIYNLSNTNSSGIGSNLIGLFCDADNATFNSFAGNFIYNFSGNSSTAFYGIRNNNGINKFYNNIINLGSDSINTIYGIWENSASSSSIDTIYFNTVYIGGSPATLALSSYALYSNAISGTFNKSIKNNILYNARSNIGTASGKHYAAFFNYSSSSNLTLNYNDYFTPGVGGQIGNYAGTDVNLPIIPANDANSLNINPNLVNAGGANPGDYRPTAALSGINVNSITTDYYSINRSNTAPTMGALETSNVDVYQSNVYQSSYTTLKQAFDFINTGVHTGILTVKIKGNTIETAPAVLNASGIGLANYSSVTVIPIGIRTVTGAIAAGSPLIDLNGADNVCINGLNNGTDSLILINTTVSATPGTSTLRFIADASNDTVINCTILGAANANSGIAAGTILFSTGTTTGNDKNVISSNSIGNITGSNPTSVITSAGTSAVVSNDSITITGNKIYNWYATNGANAINITANSSAWDINNNKFYQTAAQSGLTSGNYLKCIYVNAGSAYSISNNILGYANADASGMLSNSGGRFTGIELDVDSNPVSNIQGNIINNINWTTASGASNPGGAIFNGIIVKEGKINIGTTNANIIGRTTGVGSGTSGIYVTSTTSNAAIVPIYVSSDASCNISNNSIGAIATGGTANIGYYFYGISIDEGGNHIVNQNNIGSSTYGSIAIGTLGTTTAACYLYGINSTCTGAINIGNTIGTGNIIHNLCNNSLGTGLIWAISNNGAITGLSTISYNTIDSLFFPTTTSSSNCYLINNINAVDSLYISNNIFGSNAAGYTGTTGGSGNFYGIYQSGTPFKTVISNNVFNNMSVKTSGTIGLIWNNYTAQANGIKIIQNNSILNGFSRTQATSTANFYCYYDNSNSPSTANITISGNNFSKINSNTTGSNSFFGIYNNNSVNNPSLTVYNNILDSISFNGTTQINLIYLNGFGGTAGTPNLVYGNRVSNFSSNTNAIIFGIYIGPQSLYVNTYNDTVQNFTLSGASTLYGIYGGGTSNLNKFYNNSINNLSNTAAGAIHGVFINSGTTMNIYQNAINSISSLGNVNGITINGGTTVNIFQHKPTGTNNYSLYGLTSGGTTTSANGISVLAGNSVKIYKNNIYNISNTSNGNTIPLVNGILLAGGTNDTVINNTIGDLTAPAAINSDAIRAIAVTSFTASSNYNLFYNTINLTASGGTTFGTSGIYHTTHGFATIANLTLRNNIIVNSSTPSGAGISAAYRRSSSILANYNAASNNNLFYSGTPSATRPIMYDGSTAYQTLANYKTAVASRDAASISENPNWANLTGSAADYLHINNTILTAIDNGAVNIPNITDDIDNEIRQGNAGYTGLGTAPDMGADEFDLICGGVSSSSIIAKYLPIICAGSSDSLWLITSDTLPGITYQWASAISYGGPYTNMGTAINQPIPALFATTYYKCTIKCSNTGDSTVTAIDSIIVSPASQGGIATAASPVVCIGTGTTINLSAYTGTIQWQSSPDSLVWTNLTGQTSSTLSTGNLTTYYYYRAIVSSSPCIPDTSTVAKVTIDPLTVASITYTGSPYCNSLSTAQAVTLTGATGGSFSAPAGLSINASTGEITPSSSTSGTFTVTYTIAAAGICNTVTTTASVTIVTSPAATISYAGSPYCKTLSTPQSITFSGTTGGTYAASPVGLSIDAATGAITPNTSTAGTYSVTYTIAAAGACPTVTTTTSVTINALPTASITYAGTPFCNSLTIAQSVSLTGATGGSYAAPVGLNIDALSGDINPSLSTAGTYTVTYTIAAAGGCATVTTTASVTVTALPAATISYAGSPYCKTVSTPQSITLTGTTGGTYTASPAGLTINTASGAVTPSTSTAGTYTVTYIIAATGGCQTVTTTTTVTINALPVATISYAGTPFCQTLTTPQFVTITGATGGTFTSTSGLSINTVNGDITPSSSTAGTYTVTYIIDAAGGCATVTTTASVTVTALPTATINYTGSPYCKTLTTPQSITLTGTTGGTYTASPAGLTINAATGAITPSSSIAGTYTVTYTIAAAGGCQSVTTTTTVTINVIPVASISYAGSPFCQTIATAQSVTITGAGGGTFTSTTGLSINTANGDITPSTSTAGTYTVTYIIAAAGGCATVTTTASVTVTALPTATISYAGSPYCKTLSTPQSITLTGTTGGTYTASPAGLTINAASGAVTPSSSTAGTYTVTYTIAAAGGCQTVTTTTTVTINAIPVASISYAGSPFCQTLASAQSVTITGAGGGTFTSTTGLSINTANGDITPSTSTAGTYTVTYIIAAAGGCATVTTTASVTVTALPTATISYAGSPYCKTVSIPQSITLTGTTSGTYTASPAGLTINAATGAITPSSSTAGTYTVTYTIAAAGGCQSVTTTTTVTINALPVASISYAGSPFCQTLATAQSATITGAGGGTFTSTTGLSINTANGDITPSTSTAGTYTVTYIIAAAGGCATVTTTASVTVTALPTATISYAGSPYCKTVSTPQSITLTGTTGGTYTASPAGLTINAATGAITPSSSTAGTYTVTYTIAAAGGCQTVTTTTTVTINALPVANISYAGSPFCQTLASAQSVTITGAGGGTFTSTTGLSINTANGDITPGTSTAGTYTVTYIIAAAGGCATVTTTASVTITALPIASYTYSADTYCSNLANPLPSYISGGSAGIFSATPVGLSFISTATGQINLSGSTPGTYTITNTKIALNGCPAVTAADTITIFAAPTATITYTANPYCKTISTAQAVTRTGATGGIYTALPTGLTLDTVTGAVTPSSSTAGTYTVTYTIAAAGGCNTVTVTTSVTITTAPTATISYTGTPYCQSQTTAQSVTLTGTTGGTYSATPASLSINASTGAIIPNTSSAGTYTVTYTIAAAGGCQTVTATTTVTITASPSATILYLGSPYCKSLTTSQAVTRTGTSGGTYTALPVGLTLDSVSGAVIPSSSTAGTYTVTYTIAAAGGCNTATFTASVTITAVPLASYTYSANIFCSNLTNPSPSYFGGGSAGIFSATPAGLNFVSTATGQINLTTSAAGTYIITNTKAASGCPSATASDTITITIAPSATISYAGTPFCRTLTTAQPVTRTGTAGGTYSATPGGLSINASTGAITPSASTAGTYSVTYTMAASGSCNTVTTSTSVTITNAPTAFINYPGSPYCDSDTNSKAVVRIGTAGGTYSASPAGLSLNSSTGAVKPSTSTPGTYTVTYTIAAAGGCATVTASRSVTITAMPTASISYAGTPFCTSVTTPQSVTLVGTTGGNFTYTPGTSTLTLNTSTGAITPSTSTNGNYMVTYTIVAAGGCPKVTDSTSVTITLQPILKDSSNAPICEEESLLLYSTFINGATYHWSGPNGWGSPQQNPVVSTFATASLSGVYNLSVTGIPGGCPDMNESITIVVNPKPVANFSYTPTYPEMGEDIYLSYTGSTANLWNWYLNGILFSNVEKPVFRLDSYGNSLIYLYVQNTFGCKDTVSKFIYVKELSKIWIPNAFTPDGDGYNDVYLVYSVNPLKKFNMKIFNRWGQMVFETENITEGWDGKYKGEECPIGTYVVVINYTQSQIDQSFQLNESVTLIR